MATGAERDALIEKHREYANALVHTICKTLPRFVSRDELLAVGAQGLVEAANRFDPTRGIQFTTFSYYRVRGAVFDYLRKTVQTDPYCRARASADAAIDELTQAALLERQRTANEGPAEAAALLSDLLDSVTTVLTVTECGEALQSESSRDDPEHNAAVSQMSGALKEAMKKLPEKERLFVEQVYFEGKTIEEVGQTMGLSKSWSSRLHARALKLLREQVPNFEPKT